MKLFLMLVFLFLPFFAKANIFVGNPSNGIVINGTVVVRDLFSFGNYKSPWVGNRVLPNLPLPELHIKVPEKILLQKISDIEYSCPGFGTILLKTMAMYNWVMVDEQLQTIDAKDDPIMLPPGARLVQLATRLRTTIRIQRSLWNRLDDVNKVALILHETLYSLVTPVQRKDDSSYQPTQAVVDLVGNFFLPSFTHSYLAEDLSLNPSNYGLSIPDFQPGYNSDWKIAIKSGFTDLGKKHQTFDEEYEGKTFSHLWLNYMAAKICTTTVSQSQVSINPAYSYEASAWRWKLEPTMFQYQENGSPQLAVAFKYTNENYQQSMKNIINLSDCIFSAKRINSYVSHGMGQ